MRFSWKAEANAAFLLLKKAFTTAPVLMNFDQEAPMIIETDALDYVSAGVRSQPDDEGIQHPVAFFSKQHSPAECKYKIYDEELLAVIRCFEEWRPHLESTGHTIQVLSGHQHLKFCKTTKLVNRPHARWSEFPSRFNFKIQ